MDHWTEQLGESGNASFPLPDPVFGGTPLLCAMRLCEDADHGHLGFLFRCRVESRRRVVTRCIACVAVGHATACRQTVEGGSDSVPPGPA